MFFWILVALLVLALVFMQLSSFSKKKGKNEGIDSADADLQIYSMQLKEIDRDSANGLIDEVSAQEARLEISRALLKTEKTVKKILIKQPLSFLMRYFLSFSILLIPILAIIIYSQYGSPDLPSRPFSLIMNEKLEELSPAEKLARFEVLALRNPLDGSITDKLAFNYLMTNQFIKAANSYQDSIRLNGETAERLAAYAMALTMNEGGIVTNDARRLFEKSESLDKNYYLAQFYLATASIQDAKPEEALERLQDFYKRLPENSSVRIALKNQITELKEQLNGKKREFLLEELQEKLNADPNRLEGWQLLVKGWLASGKKDKALQALRDGVEKTDAKSAEKLKDFAKKNGLDWVGGQ